MKRKFLIIYILLCLITGCGITYKPYDFENSQVISEPDYSDENNWAVLPYKYPEVINPTICSGSTIDKVMPLLIGVVEEGTAKNIHSDKYQIAGKTGTGQWRNHNMKLNLAWFVGFAPVEKPEVAIAVLIEGIIPQDKIQGGLTATPVARDILKAYFESSGKGLARSE